MEMLAAVIQFQINSSPPQTNQLGGCCQKKIIISNYSASDSNHHLVASPSASIWWNSQLMPDPTWSSRTISTHDTRPLAAIYQMPDLHGQ
jgi:hypothetical protein